MSLLKYKYYDTPEGQDVYKKVFVTSKYAGLAGMAMATMDVLMFSHPKGIFNTGFRYAFILGPMVGMAAGFAVTANVAQNIRGKNDKLNYFLGGAVSGAIFTAWQRVGAIALPAVIVLGTCAVIKKIAIDENWTLFPEITTAHNSIQFKGHDWTLAKDVDHLKTWTTGSK